jgi:L-ribulose-5-phosphate 4-epimerase
MFESLKEKVWKANLELYKNNLIIQTWGNVSGIDRERGIVVIKPSGVRYTDLKPDQMVTVDLDGNVIKSKLRPSSDTPTHLMLYQGLADINAVAHTHSEYATMFAQAGREIPCLGTTHADHFRGTIPLTRYLNKDEVEKDYERNTGRIILERFAGLDYRDIPAVLVAGHGAFCWGTSPEDAVTNCVVLEKIARMYLGTLLLNPACPELPEHLLKKHFVRKHGPDAYYGQPEK